MNLKTLSPLPSQRSDEDSRAFDMERDGFVDDEVILALVAGPTSPRPTGAGSDLVLAADDMDFAGWSLPSALPSHAARTEISPERRPAPPELQEPGIGEPHRGSHRWWLAGLAGALSSMIFTLVLIAISNRPAPDVNVITVIRPQPKAQGLPADSMSDPKVSSEITGMTLEE